MKIIYLSASNIPSRTANSIQVMRMCEAFAKNGHETILVGRQFDSKPVRDVYEYYGVERNFELALFPCRKIKGVGLFLLPKLYVWLRRYDPKEVTIYARDIYGASLAVRMGFTAIYEAHAEPYHFLTNRLEAALFKKHRLARLVVISQALKDIYISKFNLKKEILVCHDAANIPKESKNGDIPWPLCRNTLQIGYTGHLYQGRGIDIILACAKQLPQFDFHVVGGTENDIQNWKTSAPANTHFHGFIEPGLIQAIRNKCNVLLMPYQHHVIDPRSQLDTSRCMSPLKLFEYMASGRTIIASNLPILREVLDQKTAELVTPDRPEEWVEAIRRCEDRRHRDILAQNAYALFLKHYTWQKRAERAVKGLNG